MKKKLLSLVMAVAMVLSLAVPAFATNYWEYSSDTSKQDKAEQKLEFNARTFTPTISLILPDIGGTNIPMVLNPYRIEYTGNIGTESAKINGQVVSSANWNDQIICPIYAIQNKTNAKLNVKASTESVRNGDVAWATGNHVALDDTSKTAMINLVIKKTSVDSSWTNNAAYGINIASAMGKLDAYDTANNSVIKLADTTNEVQVATLKNASIEPDNSKTNYMLFQFDGELSRNSTTAWTASDKIKTTVTFTFTPVSIGDAKATYVRTDAVENTDTPRAITLNMPSPNGNSITPGDAFTNFGANPDGAAGWVPSLDNTDPGWTPVDVSAFGANAVSFTAGTRGAYTMTISADALAKLPKDGQAHDYNIVLGFKDKNGVPRTAELTLTLTRTAAGGS